MGEIEIKEKLKGLPFFRGLSDDQLDIVGEHVQLEEFKPQATVFEEGDPGDTVYFIIEGSLDVSMDSDWGEMVKLATLSDGSSFGEMSVIDDLPRSASVVATISTTVLSLKKEAFEQILDNHPDIGVILLKGLAGFLCKHMRESNESLSDFLEPV